MDENRINARVNSWAESKSGRNCKNWNFRVIYRFKSIKTGVLLIFSFITGDKIEFLPPMMFLNEYITGI